MDKVDKLLAAYNIQLEELILLEKQQLNTINHKKHDKPNEKQQVGFVLDMTWETQELNIIRTKIKLIQRFIADLDSLKDI